ncbi:IS5 family transposase [Phytomonospora endophytica]|uniref:IS5 family transposase n=1 Tax=Phytomonospora endophytica TaxID=714109 RepID=UPI0028893B20|nr:IS5 family transposase [Phytomonospora endophytica]
MWPDKSPGPRPLDDRLCLQGILFVLHTGIGWEDLPQELGYGSGMTCWRRLKRWSDAGVFDQLHQVLLGELNAAGRIDWTRAVADGGHLRAKKGGEGVGPSPVDRGRPGSKHHVICDGAGVPLRVITTGGNIPDVTQAIALVDGIRPVRGRPGRPRRRFEALLADKGYDSHAVREQITARRIMPIIPRRGTTGIARLGKLRYVVEQTISHLHQFKRLAIRWDKHLDIHDALVSLACALICHRRLPRSC